MKFFRSQRYRGRLIQKAFSWFAAFLVLFISSAYVLRDPNTGMLTLGQVSLEHHHHMGTPLDHTAHHTHCEFCFAPALTTGTPTRIVSSQMRIEKLHFVFLVLYRHLASLQALQARAPPFKISKA